MNLTIAAQNLVNKLEEIGKNESFISVFVMSQIRGNPYNGPNWSKEFEELKKELDKNNEKLKKI